MKIRKIEKPCSDRPITNPETTRHNHPADPRGERAMTDGRRGRRHRKPIKVWTLWHVSPLRGRAVPGRLCTSSASGNTHPKVSFDSERLATLETFSNRNGGLDCAIFNESANSAVYTRRRAYGLRSDRLARATASKDYAACVSSLSRADSGASVSSCGGTRISPLSLTSSNRTETCLDTPDSCIVTP